MISMKLYSTECLSSTDTVLDKDNRNVIVLANSLLCMQVLCRCVCKAYNYVSD